MKRRDFMKAALASPAGMVKEEKEERVCTGTFYPDGKHLIMDDEGRTCFAVKDVWKHRKSGSKFQIHIHKDGLDVRFVD